jgi:hypothetical protein
MHLPIDFGGTRKLHSIQAGAGEDTSRARRSPLERPLHTEAQLTVNQLRIAYFGEAAASRAEKRTCDRRTFIDLQPEDTRPGCCVALNRPSSDERIRAVRSNYKQRQTHTSRRLGGHDLSEDRLDRELDGSRR